MDQPVFYFSDRCPHCERVLPEIVDFFNTRGIQLVIRKPTLVEMPVIPGYPALKLPGINGVPILMVGSDIAEALREKPELLDGSSHNRLSKPSVGDGNPSLQL